MCILGKKKLHIPAMVSPSASRFPKKNGREHLKRPLIEDQKSDQCDGIPCMRRTNATVTLKEKHNFT
jgi:hypothetical protein